MDDLLRGRADQIALVVLDADGRRLPARCGAVVEIGRHARTGTGVDVDGRPDSSVETGQVTASLTVHHRNGAGASSPTRLWLDLPSPEWPRRVARALAPLRDARQASGTRGLPDSVRLLDVVGAPSVEGLVGRWADSRRSSVRMVLGATTNGPLEVDLRVDGPHVLVGGTTGAGKSELLQTLVCSLALANRPDQLSFLLVDYKGGAAFRGCARLPHVCGLVTDLDAHLTARALVSLGAELRRRERLLAAVGVASLDDYEARRATDPRRPPVPRLVIVVDEFRVLAEELPDFVTGLVRLAAVGRSLGVHLVLATQRPGGVVSADIRANVSLRIALRVRDRADSVDVLDAPDAAHIGAGTPGRAYLRGATTPLTEFQTARVTSVAPPPTALTITDAPPWWAPTPNAAATAAATAGAPPPSGASDLEHVVAVTRQAAATLRLPAPDPPWLAPLPETVSAQHLSGSTGTVAVGMEDEPVAQRQGWWCWDPADGGLGVAGGGRSGRTTTALTVALGLAARFPPTTVHLYVIGPSELSVLAGLPHTATVTPVHDPDRIRLVVERLRAVAQSAAGPTLVVLVDGWEQLAAIGHGAAAAELKEVLEAGRSRGVRAVVTGGRAVLAGQLVPLFSRRLVLPLADPVELALAGIPATAVPQHQPPGRGIDPRTRLEVQVASCPDPAATVTHVRDAWDETSAGCPEPVRPLPDLIHLGELAGGVPLPVALREGDLATVGFDPRRGERRLVVAGPPRSGRTTALAVLASALASADHPLALLGPHLGRLVGDRPQVRLAVSGHGDEDVEALVAVRREEPSLAVLVDDAERLAGLPIESVLIEIARRADQDEGLVAVGTSLLGAEGRAGTFLADLARAHTGLVLSPAGGSALLGSTLPAMTGHAGRGVLVADRRVTRVQAAALRP